ncbi:DNA pilot protein [Microvirus D_HF4_371]|nr:DNA pilot protein [Microvirus D_HF4_371]
MLDFLGGLLGNAMNYFSSQNSQKNQMAIAQQNIALQKEFAQNGIQWKVADANAAGIHPLAALGAPTSSFSPVSIGDTSTKFDFSSMGQDLQRAFQAAQSQETRAENDEAKLRQAAVQKAGLENDILKTELVSRRNRMHQGGQLGPPIPLPRAGPARNLAGIAYDVDQDQIKQKAEDVPATQIVRPFGYPLYAAPAFSDGQQFEDRYGDSEIGSTIKFGINTIADHAYTAYKTYPWMSGPSSAARGPKPLRPWISDQFRRR